MKSLDLIWGLALKDLKLTSRSLHSFLTTMFFAVLILVVFNFAFEPGSQATRESLPGILWVALLFPGVIQLNRSFQIEQEEGTLQALLLAPVDRGVLFLGKILANLIFLMVIDLFIVLIFCDALQSTSHGKLLVTASHALSGNGRFCGSGNGLRCHGDDPANPGRAASRFAFPRHRSYNSRRCQRDPGTPGCRWVGGLLALDANSGRI